MSYFAYHFYSEFFLSWVKNVWLLSCKTFLLSEIQTNCVVRYTDCVAHVGLETEALRRAEGSGVEAQQTLPVAGGVQALHGSLQHLQTRPPGGFKAQFGW